MKRTRKYAGAGLDIEYRNTAYDILYDGLTNMIDQEYRRMREYEDHYWWYHGLRTLTIRLIAQYHADPNLQILDAGCGTGGQIIWLQKHFPQATVTACDLSLVALHLTAERGIRNLACANFMALPYPADSFEVMTAMDVLCIEGLDELTALAQAWRVLRPQGLLLLNLPAFEALRGAHDVAVNTQRRYNGRKVHHLLQASNFRVEWLTYWNMSLLPLVVVTRWLSRLTPQRHISDFRLLPAWLEVSFRRLITFETTWACRRPLPIGSSVIAVARKV